MKRILKAFIYSYDGFCVAIKEPAFYQELALALVGIVAVFILPIENIYRCGIIMTHLLTLVVELLNTSIEAIVDKTTPEKHPLAKIAKDMGSLAVLMAFFMLITVWGFALYGAYFDVH